MSCRSFHKEVMNITNQKYEITDIAHERYPFLHRIRALRDIGNQVKAGDLGGFVESESNLSFEPDDNAWIFEDAIACNSAYVDKGSTLRQQAVACHNAYVSHNSILSGHARAEDEAYLRGAFLTEHARASGFAVIVHNTETLVGPVLSGHSAVYGKVSGDVRLSGTALVFSGEELCNDTLDTLVINTTKRTIICGLDRDTLTCQGRHAELREEKKKGGRCER